MKTKFVALNAFLKEKVADQSKFTYAVSLALGVAVGMSAQLPKARPASLTSYFIETEQIAVQTQVAEFNENIVIDLDKAAQVARAIWLVRAGLAMPMPMIDTQDIQGDLFATLSGMGNTMVAEDCEFICKNQQVVFVMANRITAALSQANDEFARE